jgi:hypothetical protein
LGVLTGEPVRTLDFIGDFRHSTGEPLEKSVSRSRCENGICDFVEEFAIVNQQRPVRLPVRFTGWRRGTSGIRQRTQKTRRTQRGCSRMSLAGRVSNPASNHLGTDKGLYWACCCWVFGECRSSVRVESVFKGFWNVAHWTGVKRTKRTHFNHLLLLRLDAQKYFSLIQKAAD